jgi:hypothetical protein
MMHVTKNDFIKLLVLVVLGAALIGTSFIFTQVLAPRHTEVDARAASITLTIQDRYTNKDIRVTAGETILQLLQELNAQDPALALDTKVYAGMGMLITRLGAHVNGNEAKYWQYKVNGVMPQIGADVYVLKGGEKIEWFFAGPQE